MYAVIMYVCNYNYVNPPPLPLSCETSGSLHLVQPGLTASRQAGWLADKIQKNLKFTVGLNIRVFTSFNQDTASL